MLEYFRQIEPRTLFKVVFAGYFLLAMHFFMYNMGGSGLSMPFNVIGWMFIAALIGLAFWEAGQTGIVELSKLQILLWVGFLFFLMPLVYPNNEFAHRAVYRLLFLLGGLLFYSALVQFRFKEGERLTLLYIILGAVLIQSIFGVLQYYGLASGDYYLLDKKTLPYGSFQQKNVMTTFMSTGIGICLFLIRKDPKLRSSRLKTWLVLLIPLFAPIIIMAIKSKAGYLGLLAVLALLMPGVRLKERIYRRFFALLLAGLFVGWISPRLFPSLDLFTRDMDHQVRTIEARIVIYKTCISMWKDNPIMGIGYGKFPRACREYLAFRHANDPQFDRHNAPGGYWGHPHNETLLWLSEGGIVLAFGLLIFAGAYLIMVFKVHWKDALPYLALVMPILLHTQFEFPFDSSLAHWISFLTFVYVPDDRDGVQHRMKFPKTMLMLAVVIPLMTWFYMGRTLHNIAILTRFEATGMQNHALLPQVRYPGALRSQYDNYVMKSLQDIGLKTNDEKTLQLFLNKAEHFVEHTPLLHVYEGMTRVLLTMGRKDEALDVLKRARYLYPNSDDAWLQMNNK